MTQTDAFVGWCTSHHMTLTDMNILLNVWGDANDDDFIGTGWVTGAIHARDVWDVALEQCVGYVFLEYLDDARADYEYQNDVRWALNRLAFMSDFNGNLRTSIMNGLDSLPDNPFAQFVRLRLLELLTP